MRNTVALGGAVALLDFEFTLLEEVLRDTFKAETSESNVKAATMGYQYVQKNVSNNSFTCRVRKTASAGKRRIFISGNEAVGLGAIQAGCKFYSAYPMTPTTGLLAFMAENERKHDMVFIQPEGEIAALNMVAGAFFAGARSMTATSGGGFSLMTEALGMTGMTETPAVIMVGQRTGPSTGLPTYSSQADLRFILHASQGEFPRVIIAPGDVEECFYETMRAFNWAEKYQLPVILLTDKYLVESQTSLEPFDIHRVKVDRGDLITGEFKEGGEYKRYEFTETGVSPRAIPSTKGAIVRINADTHDEYGYTSEDPVMTTRMIDKTMKKLSCMVMELEESKVEMTRFYGPESAEATIIAWGSTKGPILEAMRLLNEREPVVNYLQVIYLQPFPEDAVMRIMDKAKRTLVVENNRTSQLSSLIRDYLLRDPDRIILKYDGRPFNPLYLVEKIKEALKG
jgi:2-oxoglutarate ferredoxin oxidoreductase subunit alpha